MKKSIFFSVILFLTLPNSSWSADDDNVVWMYDHSSALRFQHPITKNIVLEESNGAGATRKLVELDSKDGKVIKEMTFTMGLGRIISPDGTKLLLTVGNHTYIYDYPSLDLIYRLDSCLYSKIINNDEVIGRHLLNRLVKYNLKTKERQEVIPEGSVQNIVTSPDGRFIAYSTTSLSSSDWSKLILMDAKTMKEITVIDKNDLSYYPFGLCNFSKDGKYIVFPAKFSWGWGVKIFNIETSKVVKIYNPNEYNITSSTLTFLNNNLYTLYGKNLEGGTLTQIVDINTDKTIFTIDKGMYYPIFDEDLNYLYYGSEGKIYCLNLTDLITGISSTQDNTTINYHNKQLIINKENIKRVEISDISGRLILNQVIDNPFSTNVVLPINLINGSYLINITTDKETFTHKLLIGE